MPQRLFRFFILVLAALLVFALWGCEKPKSSKRAERKSARRTPIKAKSMELPKTWPKEIPAYPGAQLIEVTTTAESTVFLFRTKDTADKIFEWYYDTLEAAKWTMKGPTLDVAQNLAIIKSELGPLSFVLDARLHKDEKDQSDGSTIKIITPAPKLFF